MALNPKDNGETGTQLYKSIQSKWWSKNSFNISCCIGIYFASKLEHILLLK